MASTVSSVWRMPAVSRRVTGIPRISTCSHYSTIYERRFSCQIDPCASTGMGARKNSQQSSTNPPSRTRVMQRVLVALKRTQHCSPTVSSRIWRCTGHTHRQQPGVQNLDRHHVQQHARTNMQQIIWYCLHVRVCNCSSGMR
jgi:hypothetical protein